VAAGSGTEIAFAELAQRFGVDGVISVTEEITLDVEPLDQATGTGNISGAYAFAVQAVEVEVDRDTGKVRILDAVSVHDSGRAINPIGMESQIVGGMAMGLGAALGEELRYEDGKLVNPTYLNYPLPRAGDLPTIRPIVLDGDDPEGPLGAKGIGEIVLVPTGAAVANAVAHATGARLRELPLSPDRVLLALREQQGVAKRSYHLARRPGRWWIHGIRWLYPRGLHRLLHRWGTRFARKRPQRPIERIVAPTSPSEVVEQLASRDAAVIAGGTDHVPARRQGLADATTLVDVMLVPELGRVDIDASRIRLGASVRLSRVAELDGDPAQRLLAETAGLIATPQVRSMATVAGNLCQQKRCWFFRNGFDCYKRGGPTCPCYAVLGDHRHYHAAVDAHRCQAVTPSDLATALSCLDGVVTVEGNSGRRIVPVHEFFTGPGETVLDDGELVIHVEAPTGVYTAAAFEKLNQYEGDFAIVSAAVAVALGADGAVERCAVSVGAIAPTPFRLRDVEAQVIGRPLDRVRLSSLLDKTWEHHGHPLAGNEWKLDAASGVVLRAVERCLSEQGRTLG
jgi:CO/xanthine dehydrogenase FAD-binding subunit